MLLSGAQTLIPFPDLDLGALNSQAGTGDRLLDDPAGSELDVPLGLRLLFFSPHPDDETLAAAGLIQRVVEDEGKACVVFMTNGDGYAEGVRVFCKHSRATAGDFISYGVKRHDEAVGAISSLGLQPEDASFLGFPDQGIDDLWKRYWSRLSPYTSPYTHFSSPGYKTSLDRWVKYAGSDLDNVIQRLIVDFAPDWIVLPDPRDCHPDHSATGVFVLDALRRLDRAGLVEAGEGRIYTYLVHYPDYPGPGAWAQRIEKGGFSGSSDIAGLLSDLEWLSMSLTPEELAKKQSTLAVYKTQQRILGGFMKQFIRPHEVFGRLSDTAFNT